MSVKVPPRSIQNCQRGRGSLQVPDWARSACSPLRSGVVAAACRRASCAWARRASCVMFMHATSCAQRRQWAAGSHCAVAHRSWSYMPDIVRSSLAQLADVAMQPVRQAFDERRSSRTSRYAAHRRRPGPRRGVGHFLAVLLRRPTPQASSFFRRVRRPACVSSTFMHEARCRPALSRARCADVVAPAHVGDGRSEPPAAAMQRTAQPRRVPATMRPNVAARRLTLLWHDRCKIDTMRPGRGGRWHGSRPSVAPHVQVADNLSAICSGLRLPGKAPCATASGTAACFALYFQPCWSNAHETHCPRCALALGADSACRRSPRPRPSGTCPPPTRPPTSTPRTWCSSPPTSTRRPAAS